MENNNYYIKRWIEELTEYVKNYEESPAVMPLDLFVKRQVESIITSLIGQEEPVFKINNPEKAPDELLSINNDIMVRNDFRKKLLKEVYGE